MDSGALGAVTRYDFRDGAGVRYDFKNAVLVTAPERVAVQTADSPRVEVPWSSVESVDYLAPRLFRRGSLVLRTRDRGHVVIPLVRRDLPGGGWIALWTGNERAIREIGEVVRHRAAEAEVPVPDYAPEVPALEGVRTVRDVWTQAADLRAYRVVREAELREIARQAALKGVAMRREREAKKRAAG